MVIMLAKHTRAISLVVVLAAMAGCSTGSNPTTWITPYRPDVIQGNFISKEQVEQLRAGMTRNDVRAVLGTPLLTSVFHADRWDYVFTLKRQGLESQVFKYSVFFEGDALVRFAGDAMPSEAAFVAKIDSQRKLGKIPVLQATPEQLQKAGAKQATTPQPTPAAAPKGPAPTAGKYPPLESPGL